MTKHKAIDRARTRARKRQEDVFVIWSVEETDRPGEHYQTATAEELETYYNGTHDNNVHACIAPDGTIDA